MTENLDPIEVLNQIQKSAEVSTPEVRFYRVMQVGQLAHQGDVYIERVQDDVPKGPEIQDRKLAPGNTKGSRHIASGNVKIYASPTNEKLLGPIVVAKERWSVDHPQHGSHSLPSGTYKVGYQLDVRTRRRVVD